MLVDAASRSTLATASADAEARERLGYDGFLVPEIDHDALLPLATAATATSKIQLGTSILVAFARNPMSTASAAWDLQAASQGRFLLGLGSQVKAHIERRFSMPWSRPTARMGEYIAALRAIWTAWQDGAPLAFEGQFYRHTLMSPTFDPGPLPCGPPPVLIAGVGEAMTRTAAQSADGMLLHAFTTRRYIEQVTLPLIREGLRSAGRALTDFQVRYAPFIVAEPDGPARDAQLKRTRERIAFYASTPSYRKVLEVHGWGDLQTELQRLARAGRWSEMGGLVDNEVLNEFAVVVEPDSLADALQELTAPAEPLTVRVSLALPEDADPDWQRELVVRLHSSVASGPSPF